MMTMISGAIAKSATTRMIEYILNPLECKFRLRTCGIIIRFYIMAYSTKLNSFE